MSRSDKTTNCINPDYYYNPFSCADRLLDRHTKNYTFHHRESDQDHYNGWYKLDEPDYMTFTMNDGTTHRFDLNSRIGDLIDKWAHPLYIGNMSGTTEPPKCLIVVEDNDKRAGSVSMPHVIIDREGNYVNSDLGMNAYRLNEREKRRILRDIPSPKKIKKYMEKHHPEATTDDDDDYKIKSSFLEQYLEILESTDVLEAVKQALLIVPKLHVDSGK